MCGRLGPCGVAAPRLSFAGCPCPRWCRVRCAGERPPVGRSYRESPGMPGVLPGPAGDIGEAGAARRDRLVRIAAGRARWSEAAWLLRMTGCAGVERQAE